MKYDTIVIGSGISGMTAGVILARAGQKVAVLEQHRIPGGLMQSFKRKSLVFPTGVHRLGGLNEGEVLWRYFKYLGVLDALRLVPMDSDSFEEYVFPGLRFRVPTGQAAFRERLTAFFPKDREPIRLYFEAMAAAVSRFGLYTLSGDFAAGRMDDTLSLSALLAGIGCSPGLSSVLTASNPLYGLHPDDCPADTHLLVMDSFLQSSWRVDEAKDPMGGAFAASFREKGGELRCSARAIEILVTDGKVTGVLLASGETLLAHTVIHTGHPRSLLTLCPEKAFRPVFRNRLKETEDTSGAFGVAIAWNAENCPLTGCDTYLYTSMDTGRQYSDGPASLTRRPDMLYCSALPGGGGRHAVTAIGKTAFGKFAGLRGGGSGRRNARYRELKEGLSAGVMAAMEERWPEMKGRMEIVDTYTPATFEDYTLAPGGTAYGIKKSVQSFRQSQFLPVTKVRGLMLAGQSIFLPGVLGALISGVVACSQLPGQERLITKIIEETT